jgi:hypothetical protein
MAWRKQTTITCTLCGLTAEFKFKSEIDVEAYSATCRVAPVLPDFGCPILQKAIEKGNRRAVSRNDCLGCKVPSQLRFSQSVNPINTHSLPVVIDDSRTRHRDSSLLD